MVTVDTVERYDNLCIWTQEFWKPAQKSRSYTMKMEDIRLFTYSRQN